MEDNKRKYQDLINAQCRLMGNRDNQLRAIKKEFKQPIHDANVNRRKQMAAIIKNYAKLFNARYPALSLSRQEELSEYFDDVSIHYKRNFDDAFEYDDPFFADLPHTYGPNWLPLMPSADRQKKIRKTLRYGQFSVFLMGRHPRADSPVRMLPNDIMMLIAEFVAQ